MSLCHRCRSSLLLLLFIVVVIIVVVIFIPLKGLLLLLLLKRLLLLLLLLLLLWRSNLLLLLLLDRWVFDSVGLIPWFSLFDVLFVWLLTHPLSLVWLMLFLEKCKRLLSLQVFVELDLVAHLLLEPLALWDLIFDFLLLHLLPQDVLVLKLLALPVFSLVGWLVARDFGVVCWLLLLDWGCAIPVWGLDYLLLLGSVVVDVCINWRITILRPLRLLFSRHRERPPLHVNIPLHVFMRCSRPRLPKRVVVLHLH